MSGLARPIDVLSSYPAHRGSLRSVLASRASTAPEREFLVFEGRSLTYRDAAREVDRAAAMYAARGVEPGDRVGVM